MRTILSTCSCSLVLLLVVSSKQCEAIFCQDDGCPFSRTNIADDSLLIPDSRKGSLTITQSGSATGTLLAGTWKAGFEATSSDPTQFNSWFDDGISEEENVWSVGKTATGNELIGSHEWIRLKRVGESTFQTVLPVGTQGGFVVLEDQIFAGTFQGLYLSTDEGETWTKSPSDCDPYNFTDTGPGPDPDGGPPKPPDEAKYCDSPVTHMHVLDDGSLLAFYMGFGGAHLIQIQNGDDPLLPESWEALPSFQDTATCQSAFCHTNDAAILGDYLYVAFQSLSMFRLNLVERQTWERVTVGVDGISGNDLAPTAITRRDNERLFAATSDGLYQSNNGETWDRVSDEGCSNRNKPPLMSRGMVDFLDASTGTHVLVFGTIHGPWVYREQ